MKKSALTALAMAAGFSLPTYAADQYLWVEAETGAEYNPIVVKSDPAASQAIYLGSWKWADYASRSDDDGRITFDVYIPEAGSYTIWARMRTPWDGILPYDISTNSTTAGSGTWSSWAPTGVSEDQWIWSNSGYTKDFSQGTQTISLIQREGGPDLHLDKLLITNDSAYQPSGVGGAEGVANVANPYKSNTVEKYGQLRLVGNQLSDKNNQPVQLQGISAHGLQWFPLVDDQTIPYMAEFFGAEAVRLAMYIEDYAPTDPSDYWGGYVAEPDRLYNAAVQAIEDAVDAGMYVLVDWHIHNTPGNFTNQANDFFKKIAQNYGHLPNIIYEIANEPTGVTWSGGIKPYANTIISTIRQYDPDNIIIVGTPNWSQDVDAAAQDPLNFSNVMYAFHYYAGTHDINQMKGKVNTALNAGLAIFVSEWGSSDVGTSNSNMGVAQQWMDYMNSKKLSWVNWSLGNKDEASSILKPTAPLSGPWTDDDLTGPGKWLKPYFDSPQAGSGSGSTPPPASSSSSSSVASSSVSSTQSSAASGGTGSNRIEGEKYNHVPAGQVQIEGNALAYFDQGDKVAYSNVKLDGVNKVKLRLASGSSGKVEIRAGGVNGQVLATFDVANTGGWGSYQDKTVNFSSTTSGTKELVVIGVSGYGIMNLDYMELVGGTTDSGSAQSASSSSSSSVASSSVVSSSSSSVASSSSSSVASTSSGYNITIRMRGTTGKEQVWLWVGQWVKGWTLGTGMQNYSVNVTNPADVRLVYVNDADTNGGDVQVDYINVNGRVHQAEHQSDNDGSWGNGSCGGGGASEWLHCSGSVGFGQLSNL